MRRSDLRNQIPEKLKIPTAAHKTVVDPMVLLVDLWIRYSVAYYERRIGASGRGGYK